MPFKTEEEHIIINASQLQEIKKDDESNNSKIQENQYKGPNIITEDTVVSNNNNEQNIPDSIEELCQFEYIKSLVVDAPKLGDDVFNDHVDNFFEDEQCTEEYKAYKKLMENLDDEFNKNLTTIFVEASMEFKVLDSLEKYGDPYDDDRTDIIERTEKYTAQIKENFSDELKSELNTENAFWKKDVSHSDWWQQEDADKEGAVKEDKDTH